MSTSLMDLALEIIPAMGRVTSREALVDLLEQFLSKTPFKHYIVIFPDVDAKSSQEVVALTNYPSSWLDIYVERGFWRFDPVQRALRTAVGPIRWFDSPGQNQPAFEEFFATAASAGLVDGISVPLNGPGGYRAYVSFAADHVLQITQQDKDAIFLLSAYLHEICRRIVLGEHFTGGKIIELTDRERDVLSWVLDGKSDEQIAAILGVKYPTVRYHLTNCARKLGVNGRFTVALRALKTGIING